ncbi:hypothetical protein CEXT_450151 [Caerostris extrusa]|uniref:Uncharacterized protein n=1 Tax=Caerostris extrusa TaxID=172846 RepID=A0AAV4XNL2_CAEEX|nr:hypothetical protein CEXT_450151 [Caerostris extrusa]
MPTTFDTAYTLEYQLHSIPTTLDTNYTRYQLHSIPTTHSNANYTRMPTTLDSNYTNAKHSPNLLNSHIPPRSYHLPSRTRVAHSSVAIAFILFVFLRLSSQHTTVSKKLRRPLQNILKWFGLVFTTQLGSSNEVRPDIIVRQTIFTLVSVPCPTETDEDKRKTLDFSFIDSDWNRRLIYRE